MVDTYYDFEYGDELWEFQCESHDECVGKALEWWADLFEDDDLANGEVREDEAVVVNYQIDEDGNMHELSRKPITLYYEHYHGDLAEHGTYY